MKEQASGDIRRPLRVILLAIVSWLFAFAFALALVSVDDGGWSNDQWSIMKGPGFEVSGDIYILLFVCNRFVIVCVCIYRWNSYKFVKCA